MTPISANSIPPTIGADGRFSLNGVEYVILRSDVFDRVKSLLDADHEELRIQLARDFATNGWDEPGMDAYDSYPESR